MYGKAVRLMVFFEGAVTYQDVKTMALSELFRLQGIANKISNERDVELRRLKSGK